VSTVYLQEFGVYYSYNRSIITDLPLGKFCIAIEEQICAIETRNDILIGHPEFLSDGLMTFGHLNFDPISPPFSSPDEYDTDPLAGVL